MKCFRSPLFGLFLMTAIASLSLVLTGCKESDELPEPNNKVFVPIDVPTETSSYEQVMKYVVNLGPRANTKARNISSEALARLKKELNGSKDADAAKKIELIDALQARIDTLAQMLKDEALLSKYVLPQTSPSKSNEAVRKELEEKKDAEYMKLKKAFDDSTAAHESAKQKSLDLGKEFISAPEETRNNN